jgi:hypothetical protein
MLEVVVQVAQLFLYDWLQKMGRGRQMLLQSTAVISTATKKCKGGKKFNE